MLGATASVKGGSGLAAFAMSKFGIRAMAQSLAREFGPQGVHVSHVIMDGVIDTEKTKEYSKDIPDSKIDPAGVSGKRGRRIFGPALTCIITPPTDCRVVLVSAHATSRCLYARNRH